MPNRHGGASVTAEAKLTAHAAERRRARRWMLLAVAVLVSVVVFELWQGLRLARLERTTEAARAARRIAAEVSLILQREEDRLGRLVADLHQSLAAVPEPVGSAAWQAAARARLHAALPELVSLEVRPSASELNGRLPKRVAEPHTDGLDTHLIEDSGRPMLLHTMAVAGVWLDVRRECSALGARLMTDSAGAQDHAQLSHRDGEWAITLGRAAPKADAGLMANVDFMQPAVAKARIPHPGALDWHISVQRQGGLAALPSFLTALVLVTLAASGGWRFWAWSERRELALLAEQQRLQANQNKLEAVLDSTTDGIVMLDPQGRIEMLNPAAEVMFGQLEADVCSGAVTALLPELAAESVGPSAGVYDTEGLRGGTNRFPARIAERRLQLADGQRRLLLVQDLTEQQRQAEQLAFLEQRDVITGLLNRSEFERRMARLLAEAVGGEIPHALVYIDIDQFKVINDTAGHAAGDALIGQLAKIIEVKLASAAMVGRLGGDEFGALFAERSEAEVLSICEELMQTVRNFLFTWKERAYDVAVSIGVTAFLPEHESPGVELAKADVACHMAKREGRDRVHVYRDSDASLIRHHGEMHLVSAISAALSRSRFRLYAQPIIPLAGSTRRTHYEILVRMLDEHGELVKPDAFIPAAERYILMPAVDRWIIHQLFSTQHQRMRDWYAEHPEHFLFAVNLSGTSVNDEGFLNYLKRQFQLHGVPPTCICFEVTETAAMRNMRQARGFFDSLAELGCSFALDDFGSGLASYGYLRELPVQYVKIDGSFVRDMHTDPVNYALVASINQVAHVLGLKTIAEWAENESIINQLRVLNVDFVQGFAIGTPLPVVEFDASIAVDMDLHTGLGPDHA
jgi:diguanylate cyclase (GGDEF)-like protein/PAS domain S-box-containing protein